MANSYIKAKTTSLTWVGGGTDLASNPVDWSPAVAPEAGDTLTISSGTMILAGDALAPQHGPAAMTV